MRGLVTGASRGLGLEIAKELSKTHSELVLIARNSERLKSVHLNSKVIPYAIDLSKDITDFLQSTDLGQIDTFVHCAGVSHDNLLIKTKLHDIHATFQTNVISAMQISQTVIKRMIRAKKGNIIFISSCLGLRGNVGQAVYCSSKAAIYGLTKSLAKEVGPFGIRVNAISPGFFDTDMTALLSEEKRSYYASKTILGRIGYPREISPAIRYFLESSYVTGQIIEVDGGIQI